MIELFLFTTDLDLAQQAEWAGIDSIIVDWETKGKCQRQREHDLESNLNSVDDVFSLAKVVKIPITVRINSFSEQTQAEIEAALSHGATIIMLPMARSIEEVAAFLSLVDNKAQTVIQIETLDLVNQLKQLTQLTWDYAYIGLNDLMIDTQEKYIWKLVKDGLVELICKTLSGRKYGFGGITVLGGGSIINIELLLHEYTRLKISLSFLRRTFKAELLDRHLSTEITAIREFIKTSSQRGPQAIKYDHQKLLERINEKYPGNV